MLRDDAVPSIFNTDFPESAKTGRADIPEQDIFENYYQYSTQIQTVQLSLTPKRNVQLKNNSINLENSLLTTPSKGHTITISLFIITLPTKFDLKNKFKSQAFTIKMLKQQSRRKNMKINSLEGLLGLFRF